MDLSFVQSGCQIIDLRLCTASKGGKKCFQFCTQNMPPLLPLLSTNLRMWDTCSLSKIFELLYHLCSLSDILNDLPFFWGRHLCTATHKFLYQKQEDCNSNGPTLSTLRDNLCFYVVIIYSLLKPAFHVKISHILLQNDLKHQFFIGGVAP